PRRRSLALRGGRLRGRGGAGGPARLPRVAAHASAREAARAARRLRTLGGERAHGDDRGATAHVLRLLRLPPCLLRAAVAGARRSGPGLPRAGALGGRGLSHGGG